MPAKRKPVFSHENHSLADHIYTIHNHGIDPSSRELFLFGREEYVYGFGEELGPEPGVEYSLANQFIKNIQVLQMQSRDPILIHMKTCGGIWEEGMAIYDAIHHCPNHVTIVNYTHARSMSSLIFLAADTRVMMPHSVFMIHRGTFGMEGTCTQFVTEHAQYLKTEKEMFSLYVEALKTGKLGDKSDKALWAWIDREMKQKEEVYFSPTEAVELGFADGIMGGAYDWESLRSTD